MSARGLARSARFLARLVRDACPVLVGGWLPDLAQQVPAWRERQPGHPAWCSQGHSCGAPRRYDDCTVEWDHASRVDVVGELDGRGDVFLVRMDALRPPNGRHVVTEALVLTADGTFTTDEAEAFALEILRACRRLDAGLDGTPGGVPAALLELRPADAAHPVPAGRDGGAA